MTNRGYTVLYVFADHNCVLEIGAGENNFLHMTSFFPKHRLNQLRKLVQQTFQKQRTVSKATAKQIWTPIVSEGDESMDRKDNEEEMSRYTSTSSSLI